jgi:NAD(P)-dependent dehydrogenase (short-subunit alcohol dehydrogenase family)
VMIIVPAKEHSQCDILGMDVTFRHELQRSGTPNAALLAGSVPPSIKALTRKRDSSLKWETGIGQPSGNIVVTSSSNAIATTEHRSAYTASKRGLVGLVQSAALDYAAKGIRINALIPGTTDTDLVRRAAGMESAPDAIWEIAARQWAKAHVPGLQRMATPQEIAAFALVLASQDHPYTTGAQMVLDGGKTTHAG